MQSLFKGAEIKKKIFGLSQKKIPLKKKLYFHCIKGLICPKKP